LIADRHRPDSSAAPFFAIILSEADARTHTEDAPLGDTRGQREGRGEMTHLDDVAGDLELLTPDQLCELLQVTKSWVYDEV